MQSVLKARTHVSQKTPQSVYILSDHSVYVTKPPVGTLFTHITLNALKIIVCILTWTKLPICHGGHVLVEDRVIPANTVLRHRQLHVRHLVRHRS